MAFRASAESAVNPSGDSAVFVPPLPSAPVSAEVRRGAILVSLANGASRLLVVAEAAAEAASARGRVLVVESAGDAVTRDGFVPASGGART